MTPPEPNPRAMMVSEAGEGEDQGFLFGALSILSLFSPGCLGGQGGLPYGVWESESVEAWGIK